MSTAKKQYFKSSSSGGSTVNKTATTASKSTSEGASSDLFYPSSKIQLLHQRTSLSLAYDRTKGWGYQGETALYVIVDNSEDGNTSSSSSAAAAAEKSKSDAASDSKKNVSADTKGNNEEDVPTTPLGGMNNNNPISLALHLRDGCFVESVNVFGAATAASTTNQDSMDIDNDGPSKTQLHPLPHHSVSLTRPPSLHCVEEDGVPHFATQIV